jgi:peroxin-2
MRISYRLGYLTSQEFLIFALPRIPNLPASINPVKVFSPITNFFSQPTTIDYEALSVAHAATNAARKTGTAVPTAAHAGMQAGIPISVCPCCYLRRTSTSVALPGTDIELPPLGEEEQRDNEDRIFVPAQTDCWGECKYCYYCIADELARHSQRFAAEGGDESAAKWTCLRCGGAVTKASRMGALPLPVADSESSESSEISSESEAEKDKTKTDDEWEKVEA